MIRVEQEIPDQPEVETLFRLAGAASLLLYPGERRIGLTPEALLARDIRFFVARRDGKAVGCGGYVPLSASTIELKRLFVHPEVRGQGVGRAMLAAMEHLARLERFTTARLETGRRAEAAIALYIAAGYQPAPPFGPHAADPGSRFMQKPLGPRE